MTLDLFDKFTVCRCNRRLHLNRQSSLRLGRVVGDQNKHLGAGFSRQNHFNAVAGLHADLHLGILPVIGGNNDLSVQKHLEFSDLVFAESVPVSHHQNTATLRDGIDAKVLRSSTRLIGGTRLKETNEETGRVSCKGLRWVSHCRFLGGKDGGSKEA